MDTSRVGLELFHHGRGVKLYATRNHCFNEHLLTLVYFVVLDSSLCSLSDFID